MIFNILTTVDLILGYFRLKQVSLAGICTFLSATSSQLLSAPTKLSFISITFVICGSIFSGGQYRVLKYRDTFSVPLPVLSVLGTEYLYRDTFFIKYRLILGSLKIFLQALRHVFVFRIDCSFKGVS